ncbi:MAG: DUF4249 domain-containing protein, partial [Daejeonella sp.]
MQTNKNAIFLDYSLLKKLAFGLKQRTAIIFLPILLCFSACETVVEIDLPIEKPKLVVNSIFNADSTLKVNVTKSRPSSESGFDFEIVKDAVVEIFKNNQSLGLLNYAGKGNYIASAKFQVEPGAEYSVKVKASDFETAEASEFMRVKPVISSFKVIPDGVNSGSSYKNYKANFTLKDPNESNFYFIRAWLVSQNGRKSPLQTDLKNTLGQFSPLRSESLQLHVFDDRSFNGKEIIFDLEIGQIYIGTNEDYTIVFELGSINKSYFDYMYSVKRQFEDIPLLEPKNLPLSNNIKNGLGIFA